MGLQIVADEGVMILTVHVRHKPIYLLIYHFFFRVWKNTACC